MKDEEIKEKIQNIADKKYKGGFRHIKPKFLKDLIGAEGVKQLYSKLSPELHNPYSLAIHCFMNDIHESPICTCGNKTKFNTTTKKFLQYCSNKCKWENNDKIQETKRQTCLEKYGAINILASDYGKSKILQTNMEKYGVSNYTKTDEYKQSVVGRTHSEETKQKTRDTHRIKFYNSFQFRYKHCKPLFTVDEYEGVKGYKKYKWLCNKCNQEFISSCDNGSSPICNHCSPVGTKHELVVRDYLDTLNIPFTYNNRTILPSGKELDVYIPSLNLGIEISGLWWHSTAVPTYNKIDHISKHNECESLGIRLITLFDDEFYENKKLVLQRIKNAVGKVKRKIYARKCEIVDISKDECSKFLNKYHIQGNIWGTHRYGLKYKNRLVAVMTFNENRYATGKKRIDNIYELGRYCTISNFKIVGGAGKLFNHFIKTVNPLEVYSYCDKRWNSGGVYEVIGMKFVKDTPPNYFYTKYFKERYNRLQFQKHMLKRFPSYDNNLTEEEIMRREKFYRTWDCGSKLYKWTKS